MGYSKQFINTPALLEIVNTAINMNDIQINAIIAIKKENTKRGGLLISNGSCMKQNANINEINKGVIPNNVLPKIFPKTINLKLVGVPYIISNVPIYRSLSKSPIEEKQIQLHKLNSPLPKTTKEVKFCEDDCLYIMYVIKQ